jgi:hypothetical protein
VFETFAISSVRHPLYSGWIHGAVSITMNVRAIDDLVSIWRATPGGEVIKRACDHWNVKLTVNGFEFSGPAFETRKKPPPETLPTQQRLFDLLGTLTDQNLEAKVVGKVGASFYLQIRIKDAS